MNHSHDSLRAFQQTFARALISHAPDAGPAALCMQAGFAVHRNTVIKGCIDSLKANYPAVARLTGDEWFCAAAAIYVREAWPEDRVMLQYGASFAAFLHRFAPAATLPYLPGVARLDRLWTEAHVARDETPLDPGALTRLAPETLATAVLHPHAAARWAWFAEAPIYSIWSRNRAPKQPAGEVWQPQWVAEGALITRAHDAVEWFALDAADFAFLNECASGATLAQAAAAAQAADDTVNLQQLMAMLLRAGAFHGIH